MSTFIDRLNQEQSELQERIQKLESFLSSDKVQTIDPTQAALLRVQLPAMTAYHQVLTERISLL